MHLGDEEHHEDRAMQRLRETLIDAEALGEGSMHILRRDEDEGPELVARSLSRPGDASGRPAMMIRCRYSNRSRNVSEFFHLGGF